MGATFTVEQARAFSKATRHLATKRVVVQSKPWPAPSEPKLEAPAQYASLPAERNALLETSEANERRRYNKPLEEGETRIGKDGYVTIRVDGRLDVQHRLEMERKLGRQLRERESVHHRNGIRHDNRPENLELWVGPIRSGARGYDLVCPHCRKRYQDDDSQVAA